MKRVLLALLLLTVTSTVCAEWVKLGSTDIAIIYGDSTTIRRSGSMVKMWHVIDNHVAMSLPAMGINGIKSAKLQGEYNCHEERVRVLYATQHSDNMGRGAPIFVVTEPAKWVPVSPGSVEEVLLKFACGKK